MMRFVLFVLVAALLYQGWKWWEAPPAVEPVDQGAVLFQDSQVRTAAPDESTEQAQARPPLASPTPQPQAPVPASTLDALLTGVRQGEPSALAEGFASLLEASEPRRSTLVDALDKAATSAGGPTDLLAVLGRGNSFLHSPEGRQLARKTLGEILKQPADQAIAHTTKLIEKSMGGVIARQDTAAFDLVNEIYAKHRSLVRSVVFNPANLTAARSHKVKSGETLGGIAETFRLQGYNVEGWTLCIVNRVGQPNRLQAGKTIKVPIDPIWVRVEKNSFLMAVYVGELIVRLYWVGHGKDNYTPETTFLVGEKIPRPDWYAPDGEVYAYGDPKNVLGRYFVKFRHEQYSGFGVHGTTEPETIRTTASLGCIRLADADIEEFFHFVPRGAKVEIVSSR